MRSYDYFFYGDLDVGQATAETDDPRAYLRGQSDAVLTRLAAEKPETCRYESLCGCFSTSLVDDLIRIGLLRRDGDLIRLDSPVFVREDVSVLCSCFTVHIAHMAESLVRRKRDFYRLAERIANGFPPEVNLYHVLCGGILDGSFFDYISSRGLVSTARLHSSGLDYLIIAYEKTPALERFSNKLLCSYNRFSDGKRALVSFGDADGARVDFFRFMRQKELGQVPASLSYLEHIWDSIGPDNIQSKVLDAVQLLVETGNTDGWCYELMDSFGHMRDGRLAVPVYRTEDVPVMNEIERLTEECIFDEMRTALSAQDIVSALWCSKYGAPQKEIANELYHVIFGQLNEALVSAGFVAQPEKWAGQGRYLRSIELM